MNSSRPLRLEIDLGRLGYLTNKKEKMEALQEKSK